MKKLTKRKDIKILIFVLIGAAALILIFPQNRRLAVSTAFNFFMEMIYILPAVMILMGLLSVWVSRNIIEKHIGKFSGIKGFLLSGLFGALPTGPLYAAFPLASSLLKKGARISNIVIFLSAWACIKLPQELIELKFLGFKFMITRLILTIAFITLMGLLIEYIIEKNKRKDESNNI